MFLGEFEYKVDNKGRIPLPPKFRPEFSDGLVMTRGMEACIQVRKIDDFKRYAEALSHGAAKSKLRKLNRYTFSNASDAKLDGQGRIALPPDLRRHANIGDAAIIVGANTYFEIWSPELWKKEMLETEGQVWQISESLEVQE
jgi:MraZ protein